MLPFSTILVIVVISIRQCVHLIIIVTCIECLFTVEINVLIWENLTALCSSQNNCWYCKFSRLP